MKPFRIFIHAGSKPGPSIRLQEVLDDIFDYVFKASGLIDACEKIIVFTSDDDVKVPVHEKIENCRVDGEWGFDSLEIFHKFCVQNPHYNVLITHCKGTTDGPKHNHETQDDWRKLMCYFTITKYLECIKILETHETCGVNYCEQPWKHYSGGFFWANAEYVKSLPSPLEYTSSGDRFRTESWVGENIKSPYCMHKSKVNHYGQRYPKELYEEKS